MALLNPTGAPVQDGQNPAWNSVLGGIARAGARPALPLGQQPGGVFTSPGARPAGGPSGFNTFNQQFNQPAQSGGATPPIATENPNQYPKPRPFGTFGTPQAPSAPPPGISKPPVPSTPGQTGYRQPATPLSPDQPSPNNPYPPVATENPGQMPQTVAPPSGPTNAAGTATGAETGNLPSSYLSAYGPNSNLIGSQINPSAQPNRMDIANQYFQEAQQATNPAYQAALRDATQRAAATGSLGSGMLNTSYGNLALQRAQNLDNLQRELQTQATEGTIGDQRFNTAVAQQQQGYQAAQAQQALQNRIQQLMAEQGIGGGQAQYLANYNPWPGITGSSVYGNQAAGAQSQLQQLMQAAGLGGSLQGILNGTGGSGGLTGLLSGGGSYFDPSAAGGNALGDSLGGLFG